MTKKKKGQHPAAKKKPTFKSQQATGKKQILKVQFRNM